MVSHLVTAEVRVKIAATKPTKRMEQRRFDTKQLSNSNTKNAFILELKNRFESLQQNESDVNDVEGKWAEFKSTILDSCKNVLGFKRKETKPWMSAETWSKIEERRESKADSIRHPTSEEIRLKYNSLNREVKRSARRNRRKMIQEIADQAEQAARKGDSKELYRITKQLSNRKRSQFKPVKDANGNLLTTSDIQLTRWREFFSQVLNRKPPVALEPLLTVNPVQLPVNISPITKAELVKAIKDCKSGKAPGVDNITADVLKANAVLTADMLLPLFNQVWTSETMPLDWKKGVLIKLPKKGDLSECDNWRGITLLSTPSKVFSRIILNRIRKAIDGKLRKEQAGFREGRSCTDQINTLRIIIEQTLEYRTALYLLFIDFEKAFDSVRREHMWIALKNYGIPEKIIRLIQSMYEGYSCQVLHDGILSTPFDISVGVRQGCLLSPILFLVVLDQAMRRATEKRARGIQWLLTQRLEDLDFADDICLLAESHRDMQEKLDSVKEETRRIGLKINGGKTKELRVNSFKTEKFLLDGKEIETVQNFCYLGSVVSTSGGADEDVVSRVKKAKAAFAQLRLVWTSKEISLKTKLRLFDSNVKTVLFYGCETWRVTDSHNQQIQATVNRFLKTILGVRWPDTISNNELWQRTGHERCEVQIKRRKWRWIGHTLRRNPEQIPRQALEWNPQGSRKRGRPRQTWRRSVERELAAKGKSWSTVKPIAVNRVRWKALVEALCSSEESQRT